MKVDGTRQLERRAARHAALADPARLRVVDLLSLGDLTPTELQQSLGMPSNLLAHHLNVLEGEGIVARSRSEADRRRSYVRLLPAAFDGLTPGAIGSARRVVFVCTANSARSQLAAALWRRHSPIPVASAGTHPADRIEPGAIAAAHRHDMPLRIAKPRLLSDVLISDDFVVTVCDKAHEELGNLGGLHWSIPDPVRIATDQAFDAAFENLAQRVGDLAQRLTAA
ncbi:arsenate reductase/protein-tyrosine-phosphatase family protein [Luethyella okanaganae]|uniref:Helix-turn-helix domain-containing protein n=1 Tax=Luethyella okanaganae TaxID=69372 RepID=A0ABW1VJ48_9MICO